MAGGGLIALALLRVTVESDCQSRNFFWKVLLCKNNMQSTVSLVTNFPVCVGKYIITP